ncbi:hypothetical protein NP590_19530 [Methylomonas sp. SURF-2]|uniref:Uncharacterized protein n=1 Tax=Methylomonas subterranea TaxID=2952225 RepID=A0ABT1TLH4_9GAMM|nr:hypothetical protein [Methylomonas sp. SURF-2]MCQ8106305.1 hypothetical protein [Methylomonas sp. SURF-2]
MPLFKRWLNGALALWRDQRDENLRWHLARQPHVAALREASLLAEQALVAELKKQASQLAHELALSETRHDNELAMLKIQCKQDLKDYREYLQALDKLKLGLRENFAHLPEAVAFTIHHHAKQLLNRMWDAEDPREKLKVEMQLIQFMTAVHEDNIGSLRSGGEATLPQKTLAFIDSGD